MKALTMNHLTGRFLPLGVGSFEGLLQGGFAYVDKTEMVCRLASTRRGRFFLSRPRRFGKSLLVSTFESLFRHGLRDFRGLAIEKLWSDKTYDVVRLDFSEARRFASAEQFQKRLTGLLTREFGSLGFVYQENSSRSVCEQPVQDAFIPAAFHAGLAECVDELADLLSTDTSLYGHGYGAAELRGIMARRTWSTFIDRHALVMQLHRILDLSAKGLARRGFGEEPLLDPLRRRADMLTNPALEQLDRLAHGESIENIARDYGALSSGKKVRHA